MINSIVAVCDNESVSKKLLEASKELNINLKVEVQSGMNIKNELSVNEIKGSSAVLFVVSNSIEDIEAIERFIDFEYYEVEPKFVLDDSVSVLREILSDLN